MCIVCKIEEIQYELMGHEFPKSGYNRFNKNRYHELKDILPPIIKECHKRDLVLLFNFNQDLACLDVCDKHNPENKYRFTMPMPELTQLNSKMNLIQSIGADSTYLKRYLLINAFQILEDDVADALEPEDENSSDVQDKPVKKSAQTPNVVTEALIELDKKGIKIDSKSVWSKCKQLGMSDDVRKEVMDWINKNLVEGKK